MQHLRGYRSSGQGPRRKRGRRAQPRPPLVPSTTSGLPKGAPWLFRAGLASCDRCFGVGHSEPAGAGGRPKRMT
eukprot:9762421-Alexandrium_andersonii.AAC.1